MKGKDKFKQKKFVFGTKRYKFRGGLVCFNKNYVGMVLSVLKIILLWVSMTRWKDTTQICHVIVDI